jgi:hypothetical protein
LRATAVTLLDFSTLAYFWQSEHRPADLATIVLFEHFE